MTKDHSTPVSCHGAPAMAVAAAGSPVITLVGAPNSGKSTLFNALTGAKVQTGNWPGTSVEISRGLWHIGDTPIDLIDLPGAYSLDPLSPDEAFTREMLVDCPADERPDVVVVLIDATAPARGLNLAFQVAEHPYRVVLAVTKQDVAADQGIHIDLESLAKAVGMPVVAVNGRRRENLGGLRDAVTRALATEPAVVRPDADLERRFADLDAAEKAAVQRAEVGPSISERIDRVALHPVLGPVLFLVVMWAVFMITTKVAAPLQDGLEGFIMGPVSDAARSGLEAVGAAHWLVTGLLVDGLIGGVGMVLTFAPLMALMFLCLAVLEDSGYMARAAVVTDRVMRAIGLPGKAFIPIVVGYGCNVPAISATRVLGDVRHRILTCLLIPFTSCSARLVVFMMLAQVFFPAHAGSAVFVMYVLSILLVIVCGLALRHTLWRSMPSEALVIDLPTYQLPTFRLSLSVMWTRLKGFLQTAGGIIVATVVVIWLLMSIPVSGQRFTEEGPTPQDSAYGLVSEAMAPAFAPAGFGSWSLTGPLVTGFVAKEALISTWAQTYAVEDVTDADPETQADSPLARNIRADFDEASGGHGLAAVWAYMVFLLAYTPCVATIAAQRREIGWKWTLLGFGLQLAVAWLLAVGTFQVLKVFL
ncbi:ferrous iron transport protein B [Corynebacterium urealyticum]|uniref:Ferrous iron transport protein B n=1 Tax=Corynebacterium urealyticum (strain ATCC 43042 / DSM 7109) TaxID=504474 RepID=B1VH69_CORU7|nr:ferrous iron transport protein B [Corynebacterium urealyticum]AGE36722.1 ferrous iron transport protein [Corynebacterium urealyticum DSM 7111]QQC41462.1 ferrous iron transport protein B [Corynebacterium urealyticum]QQE50086.1 ferrous iron transport protein B [Corynebacterium urealyticum]CAQ05110.1 putative ferrous iron transport protein [Corynebacterium urealyticum DSM 7109]SNV85579.1 ferrous iron transport protein [Corynebacterium urealyticum]